MRVYVCREGRIHLTNQDKQVDRAWITKVRRERRRSRRLLKQRLRESDE
jgi:hypothetical protein